MNKPRYHQHDLNGGNGQTAAGRKKRKCHRLSMIQRQQLIEWCAANHDLHERQHARYSDVAKHASDALGFTISHKTIWNMVDQGVVERWKAEQARRTKSVAEAPRVDEAQSTDVGVAQMLERLAVREAGRDRRIADIDDRTLAIGMALRDICDQLGITTPVGLVEAHEQNGAMPRKCHAIA